MRLQSLSEGEHIAVDLPGHGCGQRGDFRLEDVWWQIQQVQSKDDWRESILVLHSMASSLLPELLDSSMRPAGLMLIEGNLVREDAGWSRRIIAEPSETYLDWCKRIGKFATSVLGSQLVNNHRKEDVSAWARGYSQVDPQTLRCFAQSLVSRTDSGVIVEALTRLDVPKVYLRGSHSDRWEVGKKVLADLKIPFISIPNASHFPMIDNPAVTMECLHNMF